MANLYDRSIEDLGNIVHLEHVNTRVPDQRLATLFYVSGLGLTRDPYLMTGVDNMWVNVGRSQFHLPTGAPQVVRGVTGIVIPDRAALLQRLAAVRGALADTGFAFREHAEYVEAVSPWGNIVRCHAPGPRFGQLRLGMPYVMFDVPEGITTGIVDFYREILGARAEAGENDGERIARAEVGTGQFLMFRETARALPEFDGHHVQIYLADFSSPYRRLLERGLISEESDQHQYRFENIIEPASGRMLFTIEHEVRSMRHSLYARPLVNRNPSQTNRDYVPGEDALGWAIGGA